MIIEAIQARGVTGTIPQGSLIVNGAVSVRAMLIIILILSSPWPAQHFLTKWHMK